MASRRASAAEAPGAARLEEIARGDAFLPPDIDEEHVLGMAQLAQIARRPAPGPAGRPRPAGSSTAPGIGEFLGGKHRLSVADRAVHRDDLTDRLVAVLPGDADHPGRNDDLPIADRTLAPDDAHQRVAHGVAARRRGR